MSSVTSHVIPIVYKFSIRQYLRTTRMYTYCRVLAGPLRLELRSNGFGIRYFTIKLRTYLVCTQGFEPWYYGLTGRCSNQLS